MLTEKQQQVLKARFRAIQVKFENIKRHAEQVAARARAMAGPHSVLLDADTLEPVRAATESEVSASVVQARESDPVGPIMIEGREVFAVPPSLLVD